MLAQESKVAGETKSEQLKARSSLSELVGRPAVRSPPGRPCVPVSPGVIRRNRAGPKVLAVLSQCHFLPWASCEIMR